MLSCLPLVRPPELVVDTEARLEVKVKGVARVLEAGESGGEEVGCSQDTYVSTDV